VLLCDEILIRLGTIVVDIMVVDLLSYCSYREESEIMRNGLEQFKPWFKLAVQEVVEQLAYVHA
jgi:hypothetical protein